MVWERETRLVMKSYTFHRRLSPQKVREHADRMQIIIGSDPVGGPIVFSAMESKATSQVLISGRGARVPSVCGAVFFPSPETSRITLEWDDWPRRMAPLALVFTFCVAPSIGNYFVPRPETRPGIIACAVIGLAMLGIWLRWILPWATAGYKDLRRLQRFAASFAENPK